MNSNDDRLHVVYEFEKIVAWIKRIRYYEWNDRKAPFKRVNKTYESFWDWNQIKWVFADDENRFFFTDQGGIESYDVLYFYQLEKAVEESCVYKG